MLRISTAVSGAVLQNLARGLYAIESGHGHIHHDHARMQLLRQLDGFLAVGGFAHHGYVRIVLQHAPEALAHQPVIVHQQYRDLRHS